MLETFSTWPVVWQALAATTFTWGLTAIGAGAVFFFKDVSPKALDAALGVTAGVMIAASFWSLLNPAIALAEEMGMVKWVWMRRDPLLGFEQHLYLRQSGYGASYITGGRLMEEVIAGVDEPVEQARQLLDVDQV